MFLIRFECDTLILDIFLQLGDVCPHFIQDEVDGPVLAILELLVHIQGPFTALRGSGRIIVLLEVPFDEVEFSLELFILLDLHCEQ